MTARASSVFVFLWVASWCGAEPGKEDVFRCIDGEPRPLTVEIDPAIEAPDAVAWMCEGYAGWGDGACSSMAVPTAHLDGDLNIRIEGSGGLVGWWPLIEARPRPRACAA